MRYSEFKTTPHLYLDMDGVQCDFFSAWAKLFGKERYKELGDKPERERKINDLNSRGPEFIEKFFATLPVLPNCNKLLSFLETNKIPTTILSAPLRGNNEASVKGKLEWLSKHNPSMKDTALFRGDKERLAMKGGHPNVLVDDHKENIRRWEAAGGIGVLYRDENPEQALAQLRKIYDKY